MNISNIIKEVRYEEGGRRYPYLDCYGICLYVREKVGLEPLNALENARKVLGSISEFGKPQAESMKIVDPTFGCIAACFDSNDEMIHTGVVIYDNGLMVVECNPKHDATCISLSRFIRRFDKVRFYG